MIFDLSLIIYAKAVLVFIWLVLVLLLVFLLVRFFKKFEVFKISRWQEISRINKQINKINEVRRTQEGTRESYKFYAVFAVLMLGLVGFSVYFGFSYTGNVVFSESAIKVSNDSFSVEKSGEVIIKNDLENINSLLVSGRVFGNGRAQIYLVKPEKKYLVYYFEGNSLDGKEFSNMCYDTCYLSGGIGKENTLLFDLQGVSLKIDKITYMFNKIIQFELEPEQQEINYTKEKAKIIELTLKNKLQTNYTVLLYVEGELSKAFAWQGSLIHMNADETEKKIKIEVRLPDELNSGRYSNRIIARYVPPDTYEFKGESPVEVAEVLVVKE